VKVNERIFAKKLQKVVELERCRIIDGLIVKKRHNQSDFHIAKNYEKLVYEAGEKNNLFYGVCGSVKGF